MIGDFDHTIPILEVLKRKLGISRKRQTLPIQMSAAAVAIRGAFALESATCRAFIFSQE